MTKTKNVNLNIRISEETRNKFKQIAESKAQNPSALLRMWIEEYIDKNKEDLKMVKVKDDWNWISEYVDEELDNKKLLNDVLEFVNKKRIDIDRIKELYHDGVSEGIEDGKYFSFKEWFYQYKEDSEEWEGYGV